MGLFDLSLTAGLFQLTWRHQQPVEQRTDDAEDNRANKRGAESAYLKARHECRCQLQHNGVNDEPEQAQRENRQRKGQNLEDQSDGSVNQPDRERCDQSCRRAAYVDAGNKARDNPDSQGAQQPIEDETHEDLHSRNARTIYTAIQTPGSTSSGLGGPVPLVNTCALQFN